MENADLNAEAETSNEEVKLQSTVKKYKINGCEVCFPHKAYGTQMSFMSKVITSLEQSENALLEAPTGSGKTLSLLCAALAWQEKEKRRFASLEGVADVKAKTERCNGVCQGVKEESELDGSAPPTGQSAPTLPMGGFIPGASQKDHDAIGPPRIYYATRTHSQIQQVVAELKRCGYKPKMAILGSKQHYCVNSFVRNKPSIDEACEDSLKVSSCKYFSGSIARLTSSHPQLHDVEDLCRMGKQRLACPFFVSKELAKDADIVFGPYNYFIDPVIRRSMAIEMDNSVFIFDEAHNIEDVCREGGSLDVSLEVVNDMVASLTRACKNNMRPEVYDPLLALVTTMKNWIMREDAILKRKSETNGRGGRGSRGGRGENLTEHIWQGKQLLQHLSFMGLGADRIETLWNCYEKAREHDEEMMQEERKRGAGGVGASVVDGPPQGDGQNSQSKSGRIGAMALGTLSRIIQVLGILHNQCQDGGRDYRLVLVRTMDQERGMTRRRQAPKEGFGGLVNVTMSLWCLNPGIIFKPIASKSHSVVLTSGTLSPLDSFSSELETKFQVSLEAPHVVDMQKQVLAGVISTTTSGLPLRATYQNSSKPEFMDGVGEIILSMCSTVPDGLLVFFSSYAMMDKLTIRWKETGTFQALTRLKPHVEEPRSGGSEALKKTMEQYYRGINEGKGGIFFAVCRGKVSEGLDFSDRNARGVIVVGIPYPALMDSKVNAKKDYNNSRAPSSEGMSNHLLSGDKWYEQQAFRALNQALGRCIRHKNDYGTIMLVDERFKSIPRQSSLSRWMRSNLRVFPDLSQCMMAMEDFFKKLARDPVLNPIKEKPGTDMPCRKDAIQMLMGGRLGSRKKPKVGDDGANVETECSALQDASFQPAQQLSLSQNSRMAQAVDTALRDAQIGSWVRDEVDAWAGAALSKGIKCKANAVERAMDGIMHVFSSAEQLDFSWSDKIALAIPCGLQAIFHELLTDMHGIDSPKVQPAILNYGKGRNWDNLDQRMLLNAMKRRYQECMDEIRLEVLTSRHQSGDVHDTLGSERDTRNGSMSDRRQGSVSILTPVGATPSGTSGVRKGPTSTRPNVADEIKFLENIAEDTDSDW